MHDCEADHKHFPYYHKYDLRYVKQNTVPVHRSSMVRVQNGERRRGKEHINACNESSPEQFLVMSIKIRLVGLQWWAWHIS
jgi:hypothetical protein